MTKFKKIFFSLLTLAVLTATIYAAEANTKLYEYVGEFKWADSKIDEGTYYYFGISNNDTTIDYKVLLANDSFFKSNFSYDSQFKIYLDKAISSTEVPKIVAMGKANELSKADRFYADGSSYDGSFVYSTHATTEIVDKDGNAVEKSALEDAVLFIEYSTFTQSKPVSVVADKITLLDTKEEAEEVVEAEGLSIISNYFDKDLLSVDKEYQLLISEKTIIVDEDENAYEGEISGKPLDVHFAGDDIVTETKPIIINALKIIVKDEVEEELPIASVKSLIVNGVEIEGAEPYLNDESNVLVPLRYVAEALGLEVVWDSKTRTVSIEDITINIDSNEVKKGGSIVYLVAAPANDDGTLYVSIDFFSVLLDAKVIIKDGTVDISNQ